MIEYLLDSRDDLKIDNKTLNLTYNSFNIKNEELIKKIYMKVDTNVLIDNDILNLLLQHNYDVSIDLVKYLVEERGFDVDKKNHFGSSALMLTNMSKDGVKSYILDKTKDINCCDDEGETSIMIHSAFGNVEIVKKLIERGASLHGKSKDNFSVITNALNSQKFKMIKCVVDAGAPLYPDEIDGIDGISLRTFQLLESLENFEDFLRNNTRWMVSDRERDAEITKEIKKFFY